MLLSVVRIFTAHLHRRCLEYLLSNMALTVSCVRKVRLLNWRVVTAAVPVRCKPAADRLELATPLYRASFGSPLVSGDRIVGLVASATTAWPAAVVDGAAARAQRP